MECVLNGRLLKFEDGELYWWRTERITIPKWVKCRPSIDKCGDTEYFILKIYGRQFCYHRIIYFIHNQEWDIWDISQSNLIDHIDRNPFNNNIENLRPATHQENMWNRKSRGYYNTKYGTFRVGLTRGINVIRKSVKTEEEAIKLVAEFKLKYDF